MRATSTGGGQGAILCGAQEISRLLERHDLSSGRVRHSVRGLEAEEEGTGGDRGQETGVLRGAYERRREQDHRHEWNCHQTRLKLPNTWQEEKRQAKEDQESGRSTTARSREIRRERGSDKEATGAAEKDSPTTKATGAGDQRTRTTAATTTATSGYGSSRRRLRYRGTKLFLSAEDVRAYGSIPSTDKRFWILRPKHQRQSVQYKCETEPGTFTALQPKSEIHVALVYSFRSILGDQHRDLFGEQLGAFAIDISERRTPRLRTTYQYLSTKYEQRSSSVQSGRERRQYGPSR